jgi:hypothetical protein
MGILLEVGARPIKETEQRSGADGVRASLSPNTE